MRGLARSSVGAVRPAQPADLAVLSFLDRAMDAADGAEWTQTLTPIARNLPWTAAPSAMLSRHMEGRHAFASLIGPGEFIPSDEIRFGAFLVAPETFYPSHWHAAEEIYLILSGTAEWQAGSAEFSDRPAGSCFRHDAWQPHALKTKAAPMLAIWAWLGDIRADRFVMETEAADAPADGADLFSVSPG
jgi:mannose-6-phosphate isomerase-like protein (cupin superfamily)